MQKRESGVDTQQIPARIRYFLGLVPQPPTCWGIKLRKALRLLAILSGAGSKKYTPICLLCGGNRLPPHRGGQRTPKLFLRRIWRKNNFGVLTSRYVGAACCPHIVDRSVCENRPKTLLKKAVVSSLPSPLTPNRPAALQSSSKALEIRQQSVGCFRSFFTCFAHQHHPPK